MNSIKSSLTHSSKRIEYRWKGAKKGEVEKDEEGIQSAQTLGQKIAWLVKKLYS